MWVDGVHTGVRLGQRRSLVLPGDGRGQARRHEGAGSYPRRLPGIYRESWAVLLRDLKKRGMRAPELAVGDGALGFWAAVRDVFPETAHQRDWVHKTTNVLDSLPKSVHRRAKKAIHEITEAENKTEAAKAIEAFRGRVRDEVAEGRRQDRRREGAAARLLRVPRRALAPSAYHQPDRERVRCGEGEDGHDEGTGLEGRREWR